MKRTEDATRGRTSNAHNELVRIDRAANILDVSPKTLRSWVSKGIVGHVRVGPKAIRIPLEQINKLIEFHPAKTA